MLGESYSIKINYKDVEKELLFNFQTLKNIFTLTGKNPFKFINEFLVSKNKEDYIGRIIYCMLNGDISIKDIYEVLLKDEEDKLNILVNIIQLISLEMQSEYVEYELENNEETEVENKKDSIKTWIEYWNYSYSIATVILHKTETEFLLMTPREFKTLDSYTCNYYKNVLLGAYIEVIKSNKKEETVEKKANIRLKDVFGSI